MIYISGLKKCFDKVSYKTKIHDYLNLKKIDVPNVRMEKAFNYSIQYKISI